jgi:hypothetical protein
MIYVKINDEVVYSQGLFMSLGITSATSTALFSVFNPDTTPVAGMTVKVYRDTVDNMLFGGIITSTQKMKTGRSTDVDRRGFTYKIQCQDYRRLLDRYLVNNSYEDMNCKQIIDHMIANYTDDSLGFTTDNVENGLVLDKINFSYVTVTDAIRDLAHVVGYEWYIDNNKDIHFFSRVSQSAPFTINSDRLIKVENGINNFVLSPDYSQVRNRVYVRGGYYLSNEYTETFVADGEARAWALAHKPHNVSALTVNAVTKTYAVDHLNSDDGTFEYFWSYTESYLRVADGGSEPTPIAGYTISIMYQYEVPIIVRVDNEVSQELMKTVEGGDGIYEYIVKDESLNSKEEAYNRGKVEVTTYGDALITGSFTTFEHGFQPGQFVELDNIPGYEVWNGKYSIQRVFIQLLGNNIVQYDIEFGSTLYELKDFLLGLLKNQNRLTLREDEKIDVLKIVTEELSLTDYINSVTKADHPAFWGAPLWGFATWGNFYILDMPLTYESFHQADNEFKDLSDEDNHGTPAGTPTFTGLSSGYTVWTTYTTWYNGINFDADFINTKSISAECWIHLNDDNLITSDIIGNYSFSLGINNNRIRVTNDDHTKIYYSLNVGQWYHIIVTRRSTERKIKLYVNGSLVSYEDAGPVIEGLSNITIAGGLKAHLSGLRVYNAILESGEVLKRYNDTVALYA